MNYDRPFSATTNCISTDFLETSGVVDALQTSNEQFRRSLICALDLGPSCGTPVGEMHVTNMHLHSSDFVAHVVRAVAYFEPHSDRDPLDAGERGELYLDGKKIEWKIELNTECGTLQSVHGLCQSEISRTMTINLPA